MKYTEILGYNLQEAINKIDLNKKIEIKITYGNNKRFNINLNEIRVIKVEKVEERFVLKVGFF